MQGIFAEARSTSHEAADDKGIVVCMKPVADFLSGMGAWFEPVVMACAVVLSFLAILGAHRLF
jgi:hypothetical protein